MLRWYRPFVTVSSCLLLLSAVTAAAPAKDCKEPRELLQKEEDDAFEKAAQKYVELLGYKETKQCAQDGLVLIRTCQRAQALVRNDWLDQAEAIYKELQKGDPLLVCAQTGLLAITKQKAQKKKEDDHKSKEATNACGVVQNLLDDKKLDQAQEAFQHLKREAQSLPACAALNSKVEEKIRERDQACTVANNLRDASLWEQAKVRYEGILVSDVEAKCALAGLVDVSAPWRFWNKYWVCRNAKAILFCLLAVLAGYYLLWGWRRFAVRLDIENIQDFTSAKADDKGCVELVGQIESNLLLLGKDIAVRKPQFVDGVVDPPPMPALTSVPASQDVSALWNFFAKLIPQNRVVLSGGVRRDPDKGLGLQLKLVHFATKEILGACAIWQDDIDPQFRFSKKPPGDNGDSLPAGAAQAKDNGTGGQGDQPIRQAELDVLSMAAASWALWTLHERNDHEGEHGSKPCAVAGCQKFRDAYGTDSWRSYTLTHAARGLEKLQEDPSLKAPRQALRLALERDPRNWQALLRLAKLELECTLGDDKRSFERSDSYNRVTEILALLEEQAPKTLSEKEEEAYKEEETHPVQVALSFQRAEVALYRYLLAKNRTEAEQKGDLAEAEKKLSYARKIAESSAKFTPQARRALEEAQLVCSRLKGEDKPTEPSEWKTASILYNRACYYSVKNGMKEDSPSEGDLKQAKELLNEAVEIQEDLKPFARIDPCLRNLKERIDWLKTGT